ncbi:hypothetical protein OG875_04895 [Streptomyces sp. NBC_01498]|uniref:hypothetical protein n=1 Tax=Streptomyces sp. NBC_01498 TaxID=2975870 RepID=UPI002E7AD098|nr:hypothetical protein [Streptomyces sp. NBC_01498]WTL23994.1 hypothetical protein OG875_04895 [Streptomyces sp. NBC_01498]
MARKRIQLITYSGRVIPVGDSAVLDDNYRVTVDRIRPPYDDGDNGSVGVRFEWGATENVDPVRLRAYISS